MENFPSIVIFLYKSGKYRSRVSHYQYTNKIADIIERKCTIMKIGKSRESKLVDKRRVAPTPFVILRSQPEVYKNR